MKKSLYILFALLLLAGSFLAGSWYSHREPARDSPSEVRRVLYFVDPMNPSHTSDKPGLAPCGMKMEPVYADDGAGQGSGNASSSMPPGTVKISPEKQQVIGVRTGQVEKSSGRHILRTLGRVVPDETRVFRVTVPVDGLVREAGPIVTGNIVRKDEVLATFYNRDFLTAQQTYLYALNTMDRFKDKESEEQLKLTRAQIQAAEENLEFLGMGKTQLQEIARTRQLARNIQLRSSVEGLVLARNVFPGLRFDRSTELFRIADLSRVWILADIFENESQYFRPGIAVKAIHPAQNKTFDAQVSDVLPQFDPATRTLKIRMVADNPNYALRPDMFVDVEFPIQLPPAITVPLDAVLDSGLRKTVFVDRGNGFFEPRNVETGWRMGDRVEIVKGLMPGERIVISSTFLLDSESKLDQAAQGMYTTLGKDPVCGLEVAVRKADKAGLKASHGGKIYYFHSDGCKDQFQKNPGKFLQETAERTPTEKDPSRKVPASQQGQDHRHG